MISIVSLLIAAALVSLQCGFEANAQVNHLHHKHLDNSLKPNVAPAKQSRHFRKFVLISSSPGQEVRLVEGERGVLKCEVMGNPAPVAYWMKNGEVLQDPSEEVNDLNPFSGVAELTSLLLITSTTPGEDEYTCVAEAGTKRDMATTVVYTIPSPADEEELLTLESLFLPSKPVITYHYNSLFSEEGSAALLPCRAQSQATTEVNWQDRNRQPILASSRMSVLPSGDLLISSLRWAEDMGNFTCIAENVFGRAEAATFVYPVKP